MSKIEDFIANILYSENIPYVREKTFPDLKHGLLRYDFYLPSQNIIIEYDSEIHFMKVPKFHKQYNDFAHAQENDRIKNSFALAHNIPLYRIPFWAIKSIHSLQDILNPSFLVESKWHSDQKYREYLKSIESY